MIAYDLTPVKKVSALPFLSRITLSLPEKPLHTHTHRDAVLSIPSVHNKQCIRLFLGTNIISQRQCFAYQLKPISLPFGVNVIVKEKNVPISHFFSHKNLGNSFFIFFFVVVGNGVVLSINKPYLPLSLLHIALNQYYKFNPF